MSATATQPEAPDVRIDPRFARRWIEVQRANGRRRLHLLLVGLAVVVLAGLALGSFYTPVWRVRHIRVSVTGGGISAASVQRLTGLGPRSLMVDVNTAAITARLDADPALGGARVIQHWPGTVTIRVATRRAVALVARSATVWATVDPTGRILANVATQVPGVPLILGASAIPAPGGWLAGTLGPGVMPGTSPAGEVDMAAASGGTDVPNAIDAALVALQALPASVKPEIISVDIGAAGTLSMTVLPVGVTAGSVTVHLGDGSQLSQKLSALVTLLNQADLANVSQVDLTVPDRPAVLTAR